MRTVLTNIKRIIAVLVVFCLMFSLIPASAFAAGASDISGHWAQVTIQSWMDKGLIKGYPDGTFKPDQNLTRAEFMTLANRAFGYTTVVPITYTDVKAGSWYAPEVAKAKAAGYISGYPDGTMNPENPITREETATIIARLQHLNPDANAADKHTDAAKISSWSKGQVGAVTSAQIMQGYPDGSFMPQGLMTRAEVVVASDNALHYTAPVATIAVSAITVTPTTMALTAGGATGAITATVGPSNATNKIVTWSSSNAAVATVAGGVVTPVAAGAAVITATTAQGSFTATCTVTVTAPIVSPAPLIVVSPITRATVEVTKGSIDFTFRFFAGSTSITFAEALAGLYCLDPISSTVQLRFGSDDSSPVSSTVPLSALSIDGKLSYDNFGSLVTAFGGSFPSIPTDIRLSLSCGVDVSNPWTSWNTGWLPFSPEEENVFALYAATAAALDTAKSATAGLTPANYVDYSAVTAALALPETTNAEIVAKTTAINSAVAALITKVAAAEATLVLAYTDATDAAAFVTLLNANALTLTLTDYTGLDATGKTAVGAAMLVVNTFADKAAVQSAVTTAIADAKGASDARIANASITAAKGLVPTTQSVVEGTDSNLLTMLNAITGMSATGVTLTSVSSNANVANGGVITYTGSEVVGNVIVKINKASGTEQTATVAVTVPAAAPLNEGYWTYTVAGDNATIKGYTGSEGAVTIPGTLGGKTVTIIGATAFLYNTTLTNVIIPDSVITIGNNAFYGCTGLTSVIIPANVTSIGDDAFNGCSSLASVSIPDSVLTIGDCAFQSSGLTSVIIPANVTSTGDYAFRQCLSLASVTIPVNVITIGKYAFEGCTKLTSVTIPVNVTSIGEYAFCDTGLASVIIPANVTNIENHAFYLCESLTSVTMLGSSTVIGDSLMNLTNNAFRDAYYAGHAVGSYVVGTYTGTYTGAWTRLSSDATLKASSTVKGQTVIGLGTPNAVLATATSGSVTITAAQAADISNAGSYITLFDKTDTGATVKVVKYATADTVPTADAFTAATAFDPTATITNADFFIVKVTAADTTVLYYKVVVTVISIGSSWGGGIVAYIFQSTDPGYILGQVHGLIAATVDQSSGSAWSNIVDVAIGSTAQGQAIGTGQANTTAIVSQSGCTSGAAKLCDDLNVGGYSDWYLPSKDELNKLWANLGSTSAMRTANGFASAWYWSSSECTDANAYEQFFDDSGNQNNATKWNNTFRVRAVRNF